MLEKPSRRSRCYNLEMYYITDSLEVATITSRRCCEIDCTGFGCLPRIEFNGLLARLQSVERFGLGLLLIPLLCQNTSTSYCRYGPPETVSQFDRPSRTAKLGERTFSSCGPGHWNQLPQTTRRMPVRWTFSRRYKKTHPFRQSYDL